MPHARVNGIDLYHESIGDPADPTVLLVMGLGGQMTGWDEDFCQLLVDRGLRVVRFDNRDVGLSTHLDTRVDVMAVFAAVAAGEPAEVPYRLTDMAADAVGLLDHLGVDRAHVVGASLGGMIAQTIAIEHPERVLSLTSIMSTTGDPDVGQPTAEAIGVLLAKPSADREEAQAASVLHAETWGSPAHIDEDRLRLRAGQAWDRDHDPAGTARQLAAITASGSRAEGLRALTVPTLVLHGTEDKLIQPSGGERTAELVPDAKLRLVEGMGHDLPPALWPVVVEALVEHIAAAERA
jgi:pimeloyl-ACP methyl ester carboxylesterase